MSSSGGRWVPELDKRPQHTPLDNFNRMFDAGMWLFVAFSGFLFVLGAVLYLINKP